LYSIALREIVPSRKTYYMKGHKRRRWRYGTQKATKKQQILWNKWHNWTYITSKGKSVQCYSI